MIGATTLLGAADGVRQIVEFVVLLVAPVAGIAVLAIRNGRAHRRLAETGPTDEAGHEPDGE